MTVNPCGIMAAPSGCGFPHRRDHDIAVRDACRRWAVLATPTTATTHECLEVSFRAGWDAAFRSLGAGTPEAQAALRALVTTIQQWKDAEKHYTGRAVRDAYSYVENATRAFAALATPTEEG